jgi:hypothetical protein
MAFNNKVSDEPEVIYDDSKQELRFDINIWLNIEIVKIVLFNSSDGTTIIQNPNLSNLSSDTLHHLGLSTDTVDFKAMFGDVKFVCMGGTASRMKSFAQYIAKELGIDSPLQDITGNSNRFSMYKIGPVLSVNVINI